MHQCAFPDKEIIQALRRANAEKKKSHKTSGTRAAFKPLSFDFAKAFVELVRIKYGKERASKNPRTFEEVMERLLLALFCTDPAARHGYKQVAGILFGPHGQFVKEQNRAMGLPARKKRDASVPVGVSLNGRQSEWEM